MISFLGNKFYRGFCRCINQVSRIKSFLASARWLIFDESGNESDAVPLGEMDKFICYEWEGRAGAIVVSVWHIERFGQHDQGNF